VLNDTHTVERLLNSVKPHQSLNTYTIKKMYNNEEVKLIESPETKFKELQIRLKELEREKLELKRDNAKLV
jgi:hypothetical protein